MKKKLIELANYFNKNIVDIFKMIDNKTQLADIYADFQAEILDKIDEIIEYNENAI